MSGPRTRENDNIIAEASTSKLDEQWWFSKIQCVPPTTKMNSPMQKALVSISTIWDRDKTHFNRLEEEYVCLPSWINIIGIWHTNLRWSCGGGGRYRADLNLCGAYATGETNTTTAEIKDQCFTGRMEYQSKQAIDGNDWGGRRGGLKGSSWCWNFLNWFCVMTDAEATDAENPAPARISGRISILDKPPAPSNSEDRRRQQRPNFSLSSIPSYLSTYGFSYPIVCSQSPPLIPLYLYICVPQRHLNP